MSDEETASLGQMLPVHGFVLAGGKSSRMGRDKALLPFRGRPMVEIAVEKLRAFCSAVSVVGNRDDLSTFAPIVHEARVDCGPVAGIEAGLRACAQPWALFIPIDVPLVPGRLLQRWAAAVTARADCSASYLEVLGVEQPAFCLLRPEYASALSQAVEDGERRVRTLFWTIEALDPYRALWRCDVETLVHGLVDPACPLAYLENFFRNVNTPEELLDAEVAITLS